METFYAIDNIANLLDKNCKYSLPNIQKYINKINTFFEQMFKEVN